MVGERVRYLQLVTLKEPPLTVSGISRVHPTIEYNASLIRGEIHVMTGLNKDKDKDKRSGETRVSNFSINTFTSKYRYIHIKRQIHSQQKTNTYTSNDKYIHIKRQILSHQQTNRFTSKPGEQLLLGVQPSLRLLVGRLQE